MIHRVQSNRQFTQDLRRWHKSSIEKKYLTRKHWTLQKNGKPGTESKEKSPFNFFHTCVILKHHKHKTLDAEIGENRSLPRQIQWGVEHISRWCESSSAEQPTVYTRLAAMTQVFHRRRKKYLTRKHWTWQYAKTTVNREKNIQAKIHLSYMFEACVNIKHHKLETPDAETRENRSLPRQLQRRVEHISRWCESSSAEQPTVYTRHAAMTKPSIEETSGNEEQIDK